MPAAAVAAAVPQQERQQLLALAAQILHRRLACPHQIADRFVHHVRNPHAGQFAGPMQPRQRHRVAPVCLHPVARPLRDQRRRNHQAIVSELPDLIAKRPEGRGSFYIKRTPGGDIETIDHGIEADAPHADLTWERPLDDITTVLEPYEYVLSDRLHGGLIALMMRKKVVLLPVGYHKIQAFWETWLAAVPGSAYVEHQADLPARMAAIKPPTQDLAALFREWADPALDRFLLAC